MKVKVVGIRDYDKRKVCNPRMIFNKSDLNQFNIEITDIEGLLKVVTIHYLTGDSVTYNFIHLTVQEYLCAVYMLTLPQEEQYYLLNEYFDVYPNIIILYCRLTELEVPQIVYSRLASYDSAVTAMKCLYESQFNIALCESSSPFVLNISYIHLLPYDCYCLSYVYYHYPVTRLKLYMCNIGDKNAKVLAKWCLYKKKTLELQELDLAENNLTSEGMEHVIEIVKCCSSLKIFDLSENDIGDDGILLCVHHINNLIELKLELCGLSVKGAGCIKTILMEANKLDLLRIGKNNIGNGGMSYIAEGLQKNKSLTVLKAFDCGFSIKGAISISEMLKINRTLQELNINTNDIGDEGIAAITRHLVNSNVSRLYVYNCNITVTGAISISEISHCLEYLDISSNDIGDEGIAAIAKNLNDSRISDLIVYNCNFAVVGGKSLATALLHNHTIKLLHMWNNYITVDGAIAVLEAAIANGVCQEVMIDDDYKNHEKIKEMITILEDRKRQEKKIKKADDAMSTDHHRNTATKL